MCELLWSDPGPEPGRQPSKRGVGVAFGPDVTKNFLRDNGLDLLVRSHEVKEEGYAVEHDGYCITVFSAPNYVDQMGNLGAFIRFEGGDEEEEEGEGEEEEEEEEGAAPALLNAASTAASALAASSLEALPSFTRACTSPRSAWRSERSWPRRCSASSVSFFFKCLRSWLLPLPFPPPPAAAAASASLRREKAVSKSAAAAAAISSARCEAPASRVFTRAVANWRSVLATLEASAAASSAASRRSGRPPWWGTCGGRREPLESPPVPLLPRASLVGGSMGLFRAGRPAERLPSVGALRCRS